MRKVVSIAPFLRYVADDAAIGGGFRLQEAPFILLGLDVEAPPKPRQEPAAPPVATPVAPREEPRHRMKLPDAIQSAADKKIAAELKPIADKLTRLRAVLDAYEIQVREQVEHKVSNAILAALDMQVETPPDDFDRATKDLRDAITQVAEMVGLPFFVLSEVEVKEAPPRVPEPVVLHAPEPVNLPTPPVPAPFPVAPPEPEEPAPSSVDVAPPSVPAPPSTPAPTSTRPPRKATTGDIAAAKRLITEIETLRTEAKQHHPMRLFPLLQAITAEVRLLLDRLPLDNYLHERLEQLLSPIGHIKNEGGVTEFIRGLKFGSTGDWERLSYKNRKIVEQYDRDAARSPSSTKEPKPPKAKAAEPETNGKGHQWPALPNLRKLSKPILLAGGIKIPEKLRSIHERFGIEIEWHEIDHDNPRASQTLMQRVRAGKVGGLILLEGVMRHSTYKPVVEACNLMGVPYAMGDKAGIASVSDAFSELERKLSS